MSRSHGFVCVVMVGKATLSMEIHKKKMEIYEKKCRCKKTEPAGDTDAYTQQGCSMRWVHMSTTVGCAPGPRPSRYSARWSEPGANTRDWGWYRARNAMSR